MTTTDGGTGDGRHARRERSRQAVVDAAFSLILDEKGPPTVEAIAARAGVSVSSVFRNFDGLDDLQRQAVGQFRQRYSHLLLATPPPGSGQARRIDFFVKVRIDLYGQANPLMAIARARAVTDESWIDARNRNRAFLADQARACFAAEVADRTPAAAADLIALIDALTSPEAYDLMTSYHARSPRHLAAAWTSGLRALLAEGDAA